MPNNNLDTLAIQEIREAVSGLKGKALAATVKALSTRFNASIATIYRVTEDVRARRKPRADKGKRRADLLEHPGLSMAAEIVATRNVDPALAIETAVLNGHEIPVAIGTFQRYLREHQIDKASRKASLRAYRRWEATEPCELFQFDISGVKERWFDLKTRRLLHVSTKDVNENHPNRNPDRVKLWKFTLIDDYSRRRWFHFYAVDKPTSVEVIDFILHAFRRLGVPKTLYTDNDVIIISKRMRRAETILNKAFEESGGFRLLQHTAHNAQATGKVERSHQVVEKFEKLIGLKYETPSLDTLNAYCEEVCEAMDWAEHRTTGEKPILRWRASTEAMRVPPPEVLDSAFKCEEFTRRINPDVTISYKSLAYQLPRKRPFVDWITKTVTVVWPAGEADWFSVIGLDGVEYEIERKLASADPAGEFKQAEETTRQRSMKLLKSREAERRKHHRETGTELLVPGLDVPFAANEETRPALLPRPVIELPVERLAELAPGAVAPSTLGADRWLRLWPAINELIADGVFDPEAADYQSDVDWMRALFTGREEVAMSEIRQALESRAPAPPNVIKFERRA
ncbi:MAG: hypothetical protein AB7U82_34845 [Blastocatellales bacterium]